MRIVLITALFVAIGAIVPAEASDRHAGYYYPKPVTKEHYRPRSRKMSGAGRETRITFFTNITNSMWTKNPYPPQFAMFSKGSQQEKLIIVSLRDGAFNTIFRARALLVKLNAVARMMQLIREQLKTADLNFFDLLNLTGFEQVTISDGKTFSHQIILRRI